MGPLSTGLSYYPNSTFTPSTNFIPPFHINDTNITSQYDLFPRKKFEELNFQMQNTNSRNYSITMGNPPGYQDLCLNSYDWTTCYYITRNTENHVSYENDPRVGIGVQKEGAVEASVFDGYRSFLSDNLKIFGNNLITVKEQDDEIYPNNTSENTVPQRFIFNFQNITTAIQYINADNFTVQNDIVKINTTITEYFNPKDSSHDWIIVWMSMVGGTVTFIYSCALCISYRSNKRDKTRYNRINYIPLVEDEKKASTPNNRALGVQASAPRVIISSQNLITSTAPNYRSVDVNASGDIPLDDLDEIKTVPN